MPAPSSAAILPHILKVGGASRQGRRKIPIRSATATPYPSSGGTCADGADGESSFLKYPKNYFVGPKIVFNFAIADRIAEARSGVMCGGKRKT